MRAYQIQQSENDIDYYTTDFMDVWNELESTEEGKQVVITSLDVTVAEFHELVKNNVNGPKSADN